MRTYNCVDSIGARLVLDAEIHVLMIGGLCEEGHTIRESPEDGKQ